jgi:uncharacterized protein (TIGR02996 family)
MARNKRPDALEQAGLLHAIRVEPRNDGPRLIYAD